MCRISTIGTSFFMSSGICCFRDLSSAYQLLAQRTKDICLSQPYFNQYRHDENHADEHVEPMLRHHERLYIELQERAHQRDHGRSGKRADDSAVTAVNRTSSDDNGSDGIELAELAGDRIETSV